MAAGLDDLGTTEPLVRRVARRDDDRSIMLADGADGWALKCWGGG